MAEGQYTARGGWTYDTVAWPLIQAGLDYTLGISLTGLTVSVTLNGYMVAGYTFNGLVVDGAFGVFTADGTSSFDTVTVKTNDPAFLDSDPSLAVAEPASGSMAAGAALTEAALERRAGPG